MRWNRFALTRYRQSGVAWTLSALCVLLLTLTPTRMEAADPCPSVSPADRLANSTLAAFGIIGRADPADGGTRYTAVLSRVYKGTPPNPIRFMVPDGTFPEPLEVEQEYTLYLRLNSAGGYQTDRCGGTHSGSPDSAEEAVLGAGTAAPRIGLPQRSWIPFTALAITVAAIGLVMISIWRRRDR